MSYFKFRLVEGNVVLKWVRENKCLKLAIYQGKNGFLHSKIYLLFEWDKIIWHWSEIKGKCGKNKYLINTEDLIDNYGL